MRMGQNTDELVFIVTSLVFVLFHQVESSGHVYVEISVLQYDNPDGTSYNGQNFNGGRKCCDVSENSSCIRPHSDQCDTYFTFCVGGVSHGRCAGVQLDTSQQLLANKSSYTKSMGHVIELTGTMTNWRPNMMEIISNIVDKDSGNHVDLIDNFTANLVGIDPYTDRLSAKPTVLQFRHLTSLAIQLKVWCQDGYGGSQCDTYSADNYHTCDVTGRHKLPLPSCGDPAVISMNLRNVAYHPLSVLHDDLQSFLLDNICPSGTTGVDITFLHIQNNGPVEFRASCKTVSGVHMIHDIDFQLHYFIYFLTYRSNLQRYFSVYSPVPGPPVNQITSTNGDRVLLVRFVNFHNGDQHRDCTAAGCTTKITICYSSSGISCVGQIVYTAYQLRSSPNVTSCNSYVMDPAATQNPTSKALDFFRLPTTALTLKVIVQVGSKTVWNSSKSVNYTAGQLFNQAVATPVTISSLSKMLQLEILAWCSLNKWGPQCQFRCQGRAVANQECNKNGSFTCKTGYSGSNCSDVNECSTQDPCKHDARCTNTRGSYKCQCLSGWTGSDCGTDVDECSLAACQNCTNTPGSYTCHCEPGFGGKQCEDVDECSTNTHQCQNQATCINTYGGYTCICAAGYTGAHCQEDVDECKMKSCDQHHNSGCTNSLGSFHCNCNTGWTGKLCDADINECSLNNSNNYCKHGGCTNTLGNYSCRCYRGFEGAKCDEDIDECMRSSHPLCSNNGTCINTIGGFYCNCSGGWDSRSHCRTDIDECSFSSSQYCKHGVCNNIPGNYTCTCESGYTGHACDHDVDECSIDNGSSPICSNNGTCLNTMGSYACDCLDGWNPNSDCRADIDECKNVSICLHGTCRNTPGGFNCQCDSGWQGTKCDTLEGFCSESSQCKYGICNVVPGANKCACTSGWTGNYCDLDIDECLNMSSCVHGRCFNTLGSFLCACNEGWRGHNCSENINECSDSTQCTHGSCTDTVGSFLCNCHPGWEGVDCQTDINECATQTSCIHGTCANTLGSYTCNCRDGWQGPNCSVNIDECSQLPCLHGKCTNEIGNYTCLCDSGWQGRHCNEDVDECSSMGNCDHGRCTNSPGNFTCQCDAGWQGRNCNADIDECRYSRNCEHGRCTNSPGNFTCQCDAGWQGRNCNADINECIFTRNCEHGRCTNSPGNFTCKCDAGWQGRNCNADIDGCIFTRNCEHGRCTSTNSPGNFTCQCDAGWQGRHCNQDIDECNTAIIHTFCRHGRCNNIPGNYTCSCVAGYTGRDCNLDIDECSLQHGQAVCANNGSCVNTFGSFLCQCVEGWDAGSLCRDDIDECEDKNICNSTAANTMCVNTDGSYSCISPSGSQGYRLEDTIVVSCDDNGWLITVDMSRLSALRPGSVGSDIYLGDNTCTGTEVKGQLVFRRGLDECLTSERTVNGNIVYTNELVYAERDPLHPFRIRHYNWTVSVECDINKNQSSTVHLHHDLTGDGGHHVTGSSHYAVNMSFYSDPNFRSPVSGNPLHIPVGTKLYVKVFSTVPDWTIQMKVHTCYTKPNPDAPAKYFYYIIKDGCEVDANTHFLSQSTHETRFVFEDFEYTSNHEGIYVSCDVIFCEPNDVTPACSLTCDPSDIRPVV